METLWQWIFRSVVGIGVLFAAFSMLLVVGMNRPNVKQPSEYTSATPEAIAATLSQSLPKTAGNVRHCIASVGLSGRLRIYRFSAPLADLHVHAVSEFAAHWDQPKIKKTPNAKSPITDHEIKMYNSGFGVDGDWMLPPPSAVGTIYE